MIAIRQATAQDLPAILAIYNDAILTTTAVYDYQPHTKQHDRTTLAAEVVSRC